MEFMSFTISQSEETVILIQVKCEVLLKGNECYFCFYLRVPGLQSKDVTRD